MATRAWSSRGWWLVAALLVGGCRDDQLVAADPTIRVSDELDFGRVRLGTAAERGLPIGNGGTGPLSLEALRIEEDPAAPGGAAAFRVRQALGRVDREAALPIEFVPPALGDYRARLVIESDDPEAPRTEVRLLGRGAQARLRLVPACAPPCTEFAAIADPPAIDFGVRLPLQRGASGNRIEPAWPTVTLLNEGELPLTITGAQLRGDAVFRALESLNAGGLVLEPGQAQTVHLAFDPEGSVRRRFEAQLVFATDDPAEAAVDLRGELAPNQPPRVCAAIVQVDGPDGSVGLPRDAAGEVAFGGFVAVQPGERGLVHLSAFSDHFLPGLHPHEIAQGDPGACTTDLEDGRAALRFEWSVLRRPQASVAEIIDPLSPEPRFKPDAIGAYVLRLTATDPWGESASAEVEFEALPTRDLIAQLSWEWQPGVDLDVHLVKPGPCGDGAGCLFDRRVDINGYLEARTVGVFDWGLPGQAWDDPRLDLDDQGDGALIEIVNLNYQQHDPACATQRCTYDVYVHFYKDWRAGSLWAPACPLRPCAAGSACGCPLTGAGADAVCVSGRCVRPVRPTVKIYSQATPGHSAPALVLPAVGEDFSLPGPCVLWHVARISWPSLAELYRDPQASAAVVEVGGPDGRGLAFYGALAPGSFSCAPNTPQGTPAEDVTYLPGAVPFYP